MNKVILISLFFLVATVRSQAQNHETTSTPSTFVRLYPNPAITVINFDFQKAFEKGYSIQIYSFMGGRKMYELNNVSSRTTINLADFSRGVYIYQLRDKTGKVVESGKFQVSK